MTKQKAMKSSNPSGDIDLKDLTALSFPDFPIQDRPKVMPRYSAILKRQSEDASIGLEDLDSLQLELEALLTHVTLRKLSLKDELNILTHIEKYKGQTVSKKRGLLPPEKRSSSGPLESKPAKKLKPLPSDGKPGPSSGVSLKPSSKKSEAPLDPLQNEQIRPPPEVSAKPPKNETPSRFWAFVEPYVTPICSDDIKLLEDLIKTHDDLSDYYRIPPLGEHYASRWAAEDLENERLKGSGEDEKRGENGGEVLLPKVGPKSPAFYDLTQRLVSGLMEENVMMPLEDNMEHLLRNGSAGEGGGKAFEAEEDEATPLSPTAALSSANGLEARVRRELEEQGILDRSSPSSVRGQPDEVFEELQRCQIELKALSAHNIKQLKRILAAAKHEMLKEDLRKKLQEVDADVMEAYKKISLARSKKKPPTKKEKDFAWKALRERDVILEKLESV